MALILSSGPVREALTEVSTLISQVRRKNKTMIDYYIYPNDTPSEVAAYEPRLEILESRIRQLSSLSLPNLANLVDDADCCAAVQVHSIIEQLLSAVDGFQHIFEEYYDLDLIRRKPYYTIYTALAHRGDELSYFIRSQRLQSQARFRPEDTVPPSSMRSYAFCRGAIRMINARDRGSVRSCDPKDLTDEHRARNKAFGGAYLWWECSECDYRLRFHISGSQNSSISTTEEVHEHNDLEIEYRSSFLAKSHLFRRDLNSSKSGTDPQRRASVSNSTSNTSRRRSSTIGFFASSGLKQKSKSSTPNWQSSTPRYGCVFCFANGKDLQLDDDYNSNKTSPPSPRTSRVIEDNSTVFHHARDLASHVLECHSNCEMYGEDDWLLLHRRYSNDPDVSRRRSSVKIDGFRSSHPHNSSSHVDSDGTRKLLNNYPPLLMLQKFNVAIKGQVPDGVRRWEVNFK